MLSSLIIKLKPLGENIILPIALGRELRGWIYHLISLKSPSFASEVHNNKGIKPFTVSLLSGKRKELRNRMQLSSSVTYRLRVTGLTEKFFEIFSHSLFSFYSSEKKIKFYDKEFFIKKICVSSDEHFLAGVEKYRDLRINSSGKNFSLEFKSPTAFVYGDGTMPLPIPYSIFRGYLLKWNSFCSSDCRIDNKILKIVEKSLFPEKYNLSTGLLDMDRFKMVGFKGNCNFRVIGKVPPEILSDIMTLVRFSFYSGTGAKTTIGMGQTYPAIGK